ncbi:kinesin-like protein Klp98A isoform X2 [Trichogramma pretiosum]|uniref:kinesin-like protein Klp98A isoform X2 n=1 Tax=Trichogramma pretiosum TaxID=7493 RepID=UPI0006C986D3|nr:kinesin-like protein Klp98A isoform X2 [Trichogramma pretiosum]
MRADEIILPDMASVKVAVRVRPFNKRELDMNANLIVQMEGQRTRILNTKTPSSARDMDREKYNDFTFDHSYWSFDDGDEHYATQDQVFSDLGTEVVDSAFEGYNACVFAYGQTGSGKTFTMMGTPESQGLIPRICKQLFARMAAGKESGASYRTEVSFLEIYNERVRDLLRPEDTTSHILRVREHPSKGPYVQGLSKHLVYDYSNIQEYMLRGNTHRTTASTNMNDVSSRSHGIFTITFVQAGFNENNMPSETVSKVHLVDLAGSERANASGATGQRLKEGASINKSLVTLGSVISCLAEQCLNAKDPAGSKKTFFIPYRDSTLTWLLKDSLGGNSKTIMIAAISPADCNYVETLSTLRYANRAKNIINKPTINEDPNVKLIRELRDEIQKLKSLIGKDVVSSSPSCSACNSIERPQILLAQIHEKQEQEKVLTEEWAEKWRETQQILSEQRALGLRKSGVGVVLDSEMPHLVGIDDDLLSTGVTLYHLKEGRTLIGSVESHIEQDINLTGVDVEPEHCIVELEGGVATLHPLSPQCWINTAQVDKPTRLSQGCIILLGRNNMFRYNDPAEAAKLRKEGGLGNGKANLSRLSLLSWSVSDLHVSSSSDNLLNSSEDLRAYEELEIQKAALMKEREDFKREQEEREERWTARREALEVAQRELEREWGVQWREWAAGIAALESRQRELRERRLALENERRDEMTQVESLSREVASLRTTLQSKHRQFQDLVNRQRRNSEQTEEGATSDGSPPESWSSFNEDKSKKLSALKMELQNNMKTLNDRQSKIDRLNEELQDLEEKQKELNDLEKEGLYEKKLLLAARSQEQLEEIIRRKRSLSLNIKRACLPATPSSTTTTSFEVASTTTTTNDEFYDESLTNNEAPTTPTLSNGMILTEDEDDVIVNGNDDDGDDENHNNNRKRKIAASLDLVLYSDPVPSPDTAETFHTAAADSPRFLDAKDEEVELDFKTSIDEVKEFADKSKQENGHASDDKEESSKNGETTLSTASTQPLENNKAKDERAASPIPSPEDQLRREQAVLERSATMKRLNQKIARQRLLVMKCLEASPPSKDELNRQIAALQDLQRQQIELEVSLLEQERKTNGTRRELTTASNTADDIENNDVASPKREQQQPPNDATTQSMRSCNSTFSLARSRQASNNDDRRSANRTPQGRGYSSVYLTSQNRGDRLTSPYSLQLTRSLPSLVNTNGGEAVDNIIDIIVSVPSYVVRGAGTSSHYEYEVRVVACDDSWTLLRRYRRFRELYVSMRQKYGNKVSNIRFPPRQVFARYEVIARQRRKRLEEYLRRLIQVCSELPSCEPLYKFRGNLAEIDKQSLLEFSPFFRRGTFESSKYGTS